MNEGCGNMVKDNQGRECLTCGDVVGERGDYTQALCKECVNSQQSVEGLRKLTGHHEYKDLNSEESE